MTNVIDWILDLFRDPVRAQAFIADPDRSMAAANVSNVTAAQVQSVAATVAPAAVLHGGGDPVVGLQQAVAQTHGIAFVPQRQTEVFSNNDTLSHNDTRFSEPGDQHLCRSAAWTWTSVTSPSVTRPPTPPPTAAWSSTATTTATSSPTVRSSRTATTTPPTPATSRPATARRWSSVRTTRSRHSQPDRPAATSSPATRARWSRHRTSVAAVAAAGGDGGHGGGILTGGGGDGGNASGGSGGVLVIDDNDTTTTDVDGNQTTVGDIDGDVSGPVSAAEPRRQLVDHSADNSVDNSGHDNSVHDSHRQLGRQLRGHRRRRLLTDQQPNSATGGDRIPIPASRHIYRWY